MKLCRLEDNCINEKLTIHIRCLLSITFCSVSWLVLASLLIYTEIKIFITRIWVKETFLFSLFSLVCECYTVSIVKCQVKCLKYRPAKSRFNV